MSLAGSISWKPLSFCLHNRYSLAKNQPQQRFLALEQRRFRCSSLSSIPPLPRRVSSSLSYNPLSFGIKSNDEAILRTVEGRKKKMRTVCSAVPVSTARNLQWISTIASIVLMLSKGTSVNKCLLVPLLALQAPTTVVSWVKGEYGVWAAFMALLVRLFFFIPGELELPFMALLLVILAPYQVLNLRGTQEGAIISLAIAAYLAFQHFSRGGNMEKSFDQGSIVATVATICVAVASCLLVI